ncbi:MAG: universal stress protein [Bacteroidota bacterium]
MKKILFPTDFSEPANEAFAYALHLASRWQAQIYYLHVYSLTHTADMLAPVDIIQAIQDEEEERALNSMEQCYLRIEEEAGKRIKLIPLLQAGFPGDAIAETAKKIKPDLIVMGTKGARNPIDRMLGSVTSSVIEQVDIPLLAIPEHTAFSAIKHIVYASDLKEKDHEMAVTLGSWVRALEAELAVLHIGKESEAALSAEAIESARQLYQAETGLEDLRFFYLRGKDSGEVMSQFIEQESIDILAVSTHRRSFFERLFHRGMTRKLALYGRKPLLVFHN